MLSLLSHRDVWALFLAHAAFNFGVYFQNSWSALYYKEALELLPEEAWLDFILPHLANLLVKVWIAKHVFSWLRYCNAALLTCRRFFTVMGFIGAAISFGRLVLAHGSGHARFCSTACFTVAMAFVGLHPSGFKANYMDITLHNGGLLSGLGNTLASIASFLGPLAVGALLSHSKAWPLIFTMVALVNLLSAFMFGNCSSVDPVDAIEPGSPKSQFKRKVLHAGRIILVQLNALRPTTHF